MLNKFLAITLTSCLLACCSSDNTQRIIIYSPHGKELLTDFASRFEQHNPGVKVHWLDMGSQDVLDRIRSEKENPQADLWWGAPSSFFMSAAVEGLLEPYKPTWADAIKKSQKDSLDLWYATYLTPEVITFNSQALTRETAPKDWDDLLKPKWRDKISIRNPIASGTMRAIFSAVIWQHYKTTGSPQLGYDWLLQLDANTKSYPANPTLMYLQLARQEALVTLWNMPDIELQKDLYDYPFDYVFPKSGTPVLAEGLAIIKNSQNPELAKQFYEFITTPENLSIQAIKYFRIPARNDLPPESLPPWIKNAEFTEMEIDWQVFSEKSKEWMAYWNQNIKGAGKH